MASSGHEDYVSDEQVGMKTSEKKPTAGSSAWKQQQHDKRTPPPDAGSKRQRTSSPEEEEMVATGVGDSEDTGEATFRMNAKAFWLTYSGLYRGELDHQRILAMLLSKGNLAEYSIGCERHKEESVGDPDKDEHFHVYVAFENKKNIKSPRYFDMLGDGTYGSRRLHCTIMSCKTKQDRINRINYTMKEDTNPLQKLNGPLGGAMSRQETYHELNRMVDEGESIQECMAMVRSNQPEEYFKFGDRIEARLTALARSGSDEKEYSLKQYRGITDGESAKLDLSKSVILWGASGKGKTDFAMAQGKHPLLVQTWCDLKKIKKGVTDLLVFDEMAMTKDLTPQMWIFLLDTLQNRTFAKQNGAHVLYGSATIWKGIKRIFVTNVAPPDEPDELHPLICGGDCGDATIKVAIRRRYRVIGPVMRMMATPASSFARLVSKALEKDAQDKAPVDDSDAEDVETTVSHASTLSQNLIAYARAYREESGVPLPRAPPALDDGFW